MDPVTQWLTELPIPIWAVWLISGVLVLAFTKKSQVDTWTQAHPRIAGVMKTLRGFGLDPWIIAQGVCLVLLGRLPKWVQSAAAPKVKPPVMPTGWLLMLVMLLLGCGGQLEPPCDEASASKMAAECAALASSCIAKGGTVEECETICDERADERARKCR